MQRAQYRPAVCICAVFGSGVASAATHRFDHNEFQSFKGGSTSVLGLSNSGLVSGASGGLSPFTQEAFISDASGKLTGINGLGLTLSVGQVINDAGQIAGLGSTDGKGVFDTAFLFTPKTGMQMIAGPPGKIGDVTDINEQGDVAGVWLMDRLGFAAHAFLFTVADGMQDLGTLGGANSTALAVNDLKQVVGSSQLSGTWNHHAFLWEQGEMLDLGTFGGTQSSATDINNAGTVVGWATDANFVSHAFVYTNEVGMQPLPLPKEAVGGSAALEINEAGMILVSYARADESAGMAVVMPDGKVIAIPLLEGFPTGSALAMNNLGHVVGANVLVKGSAEIVSAFYWSPHTGTIQLDERIISGLPWVIFNPVAINDSDEILVRAFDENSLELSAIVRPALAGDVNGDRNINVDDLLGVINAWGDCADGSFCAADFDHNGAIDVDDLLMVINHWS